MKLQTLSFIKYLLTSIILLFSIHFAQAQSVDITIMKKFEDSLCKYADSFIHTPLPMDKAAYNEKFIKTLRNALSQPNAYAYGFDSLKNIIHIIEPSDKKFKIFNWVLIVSNFHRRYYGAIQKNDGTLIPLFDNSKTIEEEGRQNEVLTEKDWYGCEYYNIHKITTKNGTDMYAIFGYNNNAFYSKKKILDHIYFNEKGEIRFGAPIIQMPQGTLHRYIMEYKKESIANLNYNKDEKKIIFDRLASDIGDPNKKYTYVPVGQLDGFQWDGEKWNFLQDAIPVLRLQDGQAPIDGVFPNR